MDSGVTGSSWRREDFTPTKSWLCGAIVRGRLRRGGLSGLETEVAQRKLGVHESGKGRYCRAKGPNVRMAGAYGQWAEDQLEAYVAVQVQGRIPDIIRSTVVSVGLPGHSRACRGTGRLRLR